MTVASRLAVIQLERVTGAGLGCETTRRARMDPVKAQQLAAELEVEMMADMYNR